MIAIDTNLLTMAQMRSGRMTAVSSPFRESGYTFRSES